MQCKQEEDVARPQRRRRKHARHRSAEEAKYESAEQAVGHDARVSLAGIQGYQFRKMERPQGDTNDARQKAFWKKNTERFPANVAEFDSVAHVA